MAYNGAEPEETPEEGAPQVERFREVHRLSYVVQVTNIYMCCLVKQIFFNLRACIYIGVNLLLDV